MPREGEARKLVGELLLVYGRAQFAIGLLEAVALASGEHRFELAREFLESRLEASDDVRNMRRRCVRVSERPFAGAARRAFEAEEGAHLGVGGEFRRIRLETIDARMQIEDAGGNNPGAHRFTRLDTEVAHEVEDEGRTHQVDELVDHLRGD